MEATGAIKTIEWIVQQCTETMRRFVTGHELAHADDGDARLAELFEATHDWAAAAKVLAANPDAVKVLDAFELSLLYDASVPAKYAIEFAKTNGDAEVKREMNAKLAGFETMERSAAALKRLTVAEPVAAVAAAAPPEAVREASKPEPKAIPEVKTVTEVRTVRKGAVTASYDLMDLNFRASAPPSAEPVAAGGEEDDMLMDGMRKNSTLRRPFRRIARG